MKKTGYLDFTIDAEGVVKIQISNNDSPDHGILLVPFEKALSSGDKTLINSHRHDHDHTHSHQHQSGGH